MADITLLTGASGFVGSALARKLIERGFAVRALVRPTSNLSHLSELGLELAVGDLRDAGAVGQAMAGARWVFHVAADYRLWAPDPTEIFRSNVDGTRALMQAAMQHGVERIVYTSSVATLRTSPSGNTADETMPLRESEAVGAYKRSKVAAERVVEALIEKGLPAVIVNPSTPVGPGDLKPTPTGRVIVEAAAGRMPAFVETGLNMVHVDDVAEGHLLAFERGRIGERYILGGQNASFAETSRRGRRNGWPPTAALQDSTRSGCPAGISRGNDRAADRARTFRDHGRVTHVEEPHVFRLCQG